jgi:hypothetical protein
MTALSPALDTALAGRNPTVFGAIRIVLPSATIALLDGSGQLTFDSTTYRGKDATYGTLGEVETLSDGTGDTAPAVGITLYPPGDAAAADLASPTHQGAPVYLHVGAIEPTTGAVIGSHLLFAGEIDVPTLRSGENTRSLELEVVSVFQRFFADDEGIRLSPAWHKGVWPGETGLDDVTGVTETVYWGVQSERAAVVKATYVVGGGPRLSR